MVWLACLVVLTGCASLVEGRKPVECMNQQELVEERESTQARVRYYHREAKRLMWQDLAYSRRYERLADEERCRLGEIERRLADCPCDES